MNPKLFSLVLKLDGEIVGNGPGFSDAVYFPRELTAEDMRRLLDAYRAGS